MSAIKSARRLATAAFAAIFSVALLSSCLGDDEDEYKQWRNDNINYVKRMQDTTVNGEKYYTTLIPDWSPGSYVLIHWYNDRSLTAKNLRPLYNSTCNVKYMLSTIEERVDSSFNMTSHGDSIYQCKPSSSILGFAIALTNMRVGDSCRVVVPYYVGFGDMVTSSLKKPYTTLIYDMKLVDIPAYEIPD